MERYYRVTKMTKPETQIHGSWMGKVSGECALSLSQDVLLTWHPGSWILWDGDHITAWPRTTSPVYTAPGSAELSAHWLPISCLRAFISYCLFSHHLVNLPRACLHSRLPPCLHPPQSADNTLPKLQLVVTPFPVPSCLDGHHASPCSEGSSLKPSSSSHHRFHMCVLYQDLDGASTMWPCWSRSFIQSLRQP